MHIIRRVVKPVSHLVLFGFLALSLHIPMAHAAMVGTETVITAGQADAARAQLHAALDRADVKQQLLARGVAEDQLQARLDNLTDQEAIALADQMDQLPAGGMSTLTVAVLVFVLLLITDILGYTDIFPFVKKTAR